VRVCVLFDLSVIHVMSESDEENKRVVVIERPCIRPNIVWYVVTKDENKWRQSRINIYLKDGARYFKVDKLEDFDNVVYQSDVCSFIFDMKHADSGFVSSKKTWKRIEKLLFHIRLKTEGKGAAAGPRPKRFPQNIVVYAKEGPWPGRREEGVYLLNEDELLQQ